MHIDFVRETYHQLKFPKYVDPMPDLHILQRLTEDDFIDYCSGHGDEKIKSISETMKQCFGYKHNGKNHKRITNKQTYALAKFLLDKFGTAKKVISEVYKISESEVELTEKEKSYL